MKIGYSEFIKICHVQDPSNWYLNYKVKLDGIYIEAPSDDIKLTPEERASISEHPTGIHSEPVISFPCTVDELRKGLQEILGFEPTKENLSKIGAVELIDENRLKGLCNKTMTSSIVKIAKPTWWAYEYDIIAMALAAGDSLKRNWKQTSTRKISESVSIEINLREKRNKKNRTAPDGGTIRNTILKNWKYSTN